jgi:ABC-2 type transport system ATP-binding protein
MSQWAVEVENLEKRFGDFVAVDGLSFRVRKGEVFGFLGPNGAGKSTTIRMLCGILPPTGGRGQVAGFDIRTEAERIKERIGYMSQRFSLYEDLTVEQNIDFFSGIYKIPKAKKRDRKDWVIQMAGLERHLKVRTSLLPVGLKQRLSLGCAVMHEPDIIFLDEPTAGVDPLNRKRFWDLIYDMTERGATVFVTTHYMDEAEYCDRLGLIHGGRLVALGSPGELKSLPEQGSLEVRCEDPKGAMERIRKEVPGVLEVALFGDALRLMVEDEGLAMEAIMRLFEGKHMKLRKIAPSLEDVFIFLTDPSRSRPGKK